jgi:hypothetical protein
MGIKGLRIALSIKRPCYGLFFKLKARPGCIWPRSAGLRALSLILIGGGLMLALVPLWTWVYGFGSQFALKAVTGSGPGAARAVMAHGNLAPAADGRGEAAAGGGEAGEGRGWPLTRLGRGGRGRS